ncbi:glycosyltransferase family A protein [Sphingobacterium sp. JB170]|uniref:glycosyltransferase family 2 protein n=1 Tax=Sphingobacterium sp. JB170 TaxID=1434842 RepID=UPI00097EB4F8|nr:glycosyltransferase family A protein [Sphingobacterium sp. JB170]SJN28694.1 putative glycosyltransferase-possibly involved in cell wall localization and side chain formation of rhamnose-glucose polysaccharide [Sphingobacterium sp. JB170]
MEKPLLSVVCTAFNHEPYIRDCLEGFVTQRTNFEFEVVINDDASHDNTAVIIREYEQKYPNIIKPVYQNENQYSKKVGLWRTILFPRAKGKYIALCEGDDCWTDPLKLQKQVDFLEANPQFSFCGHLVRRINAVGEVIDEPKLKRGDCYFSKNEVFHQYFRTLSIVFRNVKLPYNPSLSKVFNGDIVLQSLLAIQGKGAILNMIGGSYRMHEGGVYSSNSIIKNQIKSIKTRRVLMSQSFFTFDQKLHLWIEIMRRKRNCLKSCIKESRYNEILSVIFC